MTPSNNERLKAGLLQKQIELGKGVMGDSVVLQFRLVRPIFEVLLRIAEEEGISVEAVAANVVSGWVCDVQDEADAARQKSEAKR